MTSTEGLIRVGPDPPLEQHQMGVTKMQIHPGQARKLKFLWHCQRSFTELPKALVMGEVDGKCPCMGGLGTFESIGTGTDGGVEHVTR